MNWRRMVRSEWWLVGSTALPVVLTCVAGVYVAHYVAEQQAEIRQLRAQVAACSSK